MHILDGKQTAEQRLQTLKPAIDKLAASGVIPRLAIVLVGNNPASEIYVASKLRECEAIGVQADLMRFDDSITTEALVNHIHSLNDDANIHGILVQLPMPKAVDNHRVIESIAPLKDVDGLTAESLGLLLIGKPRYRSCTAKGVISLLEHYDIPLKGQHAVIVGASRIVGKPMALEMLNQGATVTACHVDTQDLQSHVQMADILIVGVGKPDVIQSKWIKPGAIVVDIGIRRNADNQIFGDIDYDSAKAVAGWITPVPGGVGPMTVASLVENVVLAAEKSSRD